MYTSHYRYVITWCKADGTVLRQAPVRPDWVPLVYWAQFQALRAEHVVNGTAATTTIEPQWHKEAGAPCVGALKLRVGAGGGAKIELDVPVSWFDAPARQGSSVLVGQGLLEAGEVFNYVVSAIAVSDPPAMARSSVRPVEQTLAVLDRPLGGRIESSRPEGSRNELDVPVIVPGYVIDEAGELTRVAGAYETGGILIGDLCRDTDTRELYVDVTAQVPARYNRADLTQLTFTSETWTDVQETMTQRGRGEIMCGWWHSHSYMKETCKDCAKSADGTCKVDAAFMSSDDVALHRATFPRAYSLALVVGDSPCSGLTRALFGWRYGMVAVRGYWVDRTVTRNAESLVTCPAGPDRREEGHRNEPC